MKQASEGNGSLSGAAAFVRCGALLLGLAAGAGLLVAVSSTSEMPWILAVAVVVTLAALVQVPLAWVAWIRRCDRQSMLTWSAGFAVAVAGTIVGGWIAAVVVLLVTCGIMMAGVRESNSA